MSVSAYQETVVAMLETFGWRGNHTLPVKGWRSEGAARTTAPEWFTPTTAEGWPDLTFLHWRAGVVLACEVKDRRVNHRDPPPKTCKCCPRDNQLLWLSRWHRIPCAASVVFRPDDDALQVSQWLSNPATIPSGFGWLPENEWLRPIDIAGLNELLASSH